MTHQLTTPESQTEQECRSRAIRMEVQANKDRKALEQLEERSSADREVFLRQISDLKQELADVDYESFEKMRKNLKNSPSLY